MLVLDPIVILLANYCIGCLFLLACYGKLSAFAVFCATLEEYRLVPARLIGTFVAIIVVAELAIGFAAFIQEFATHAMQLGAALLLVYASAIGTNLVRGRRDIDCGCTGPATRQLLSGWLLLRNLGLAGIALLGAAMPSVRPLHFADLVLVGIGVLGAMALYAAINQLMANAPRLDALDSLMDTN
jgi:hypothetical protein